jgi:hypothetical protein
MDKEKMNNDPQNTSEEITERIEEMIEEETETGAGTVSISDRLREAEADENDYDADVEDGYDEAEYDEADGEVDGENEYGEASEDAEYVEDEYSEEEEEEDDDDEPRIVVNPKVVKVASLILFSGIILVFASIAWFTMNRDVGTSGMGVKVQGLPYTIQTHDTSGYYKTAWEKTGSEALEWLVTSTNNFDNHSDAIEPGEEEPSLEPGDSGCLEFRVNPQSSDSITVDCLFEIKAYKEEVVKDDNGDTVVDDNGNPVTTLTQITTGNTAGYIDGHILLFYGIDENEKYTGLINNDYDEDLETYLEQRVLSEQTYEKDGITYTTIYWYWPERLNELTDSTKIKFAASEQNGVITYIARNKDKFFKNCSETTEKVSSDLTALSGGTSTDQVYNHYSLMYDNADLEIGNYISYIVLSMQVRTD